MRTGFEVRDGIVLLFACLLAGAGIFWNRTVEAGKIVGEDAAYAREMGFRQRFFYVASGNGTSQIEYVCRAFPGTNASSSTGNAVWQVQRFTYDSSNRISTIDFAGLDDAYNQSCDNRASLSY